MKTENDKNYNENMYESLLQTSEWQQRREEILRRDGYRCRVCNSSDNLQVHHRQYHYDTQHDSFKKPWEYDDANLITLCESCHKKGHELYKIPVFYI
ncbi:MAG: HNH endonuclease [Bacteroidales bacterium]